jgi:hypothetical protein
MWTLLQCGHFLISGCGIKATGDNSHNIPHVKKPPIKNINDFFNAVGASLIIGKSKVLPHFLHVYILSHPFIYF